MNSNNFKIYIKKNKKSLLAGFFAMLLLISGSAVYKINNQMVHATDTESEYVFADAKPGLILLSEINKNPEDRDPNAVNSYSNPYILSGVEDFYILQEYSMYNSCEGMYFKVNPDLQSILPHKLLDSADYDGSGLDDEETDDEIEGDEEDDDSTQDSTGEVYHIDLIANCDPNNKEPGVIEGTWYGIGMNFCYPFKGHIDFCGIKVRTDTSIFGFLGDGAVVKSLKVFGKITNEKNLEYYKKWNSSIVNAHVGAIASVAYIKDDEGKNNSITIANCSVASSKVETTISALSSATQCSVGGIIGSCYGLNSKYGSTQSGAVNFNITGCYVDAKISCVGTQNEYNDVILGTGSTDGVEINAEGYKVIKKSNVKTTYIVAKAYGYAGGLIGDVSSTNYGKYYINVNIGSAVNPNVREEEKAELSGMNSVYGSVTASSSSAGGAIGHIYDKVLVTFSNEFSIYDGKNELTSITSKNALNAQQYYSGILVGSARYALIITSADFRLIKNDGTEAYPTDISRIPLSGNGIQVEVPANVYINPNMSDRMQGTGGWTKTVNENVNEVIPGEDGVENTEKTIKTTYEYTYDETDAYKLSEPNDFVMLSIYLSTNGIFGGEFFDTTNKKQEDKLVNEYSSSQKKYTDVIYSRYDKETDFQYVRKATYIIEDDINISGTGINCINRHRSTGFSGKFIGKKDADGNKPVITFNIDSYQDDTGLFYSITPFAETTVMFKDFDITGNINGRARISGIAQELYYTGPTKEKKKALNYNPNSYYTGNLLFENIDNTLNISYKYNARIANSPYISTIFANTMYANEPNVTEEFVDIPTLDFKNLSYGGNVEAGEWWYGSLVGQVNLPNNKYGYKLTMNINDFLLGKEKLQEGESRKYISHTSGGSQGYIGGLIGTVVNTSNGSEDYYTFENSSYASQAYYPQRAEININNYSVKNMDMSICTSSGPRLGGYIAHTLTRVDLNVKTITLEDCTASIPTGSYGGLVTLFSNGCVVNLDGINYTRFNIHQRTVDNATNIGAVFGGVSNQYSEAFINICNYNITDCKVIGTNRFSDFGAKNVDVLATEDGSLGDQVVCMIVNLIDDNYSVLNPYTHRFAYMEKSDSAPVSDYKGYLANCSIMYNVFTSDKFNSTTGTSDEEDYIIKGAGTKEEPFIIDSPEKMMVLQMVSLTRFRSKIDLFSQYFEFAKLEKYGSTTLCKQKRDYTEQLCKGYYVFANDIDLTGYSFIALTAKAGSYYGFKADSYLTELELNDTLKRLELGADADIDISGSTVTKEQVISHAIDILGRDQDIIEAYEKAYEGEYEVYVADKKATDASFEFSYADKALVAQRLKDKNDDDTKNIVREYELLTEYKKYKPEFTFDAKGIDDVGKSKGHNYLRIGVRNDKGEVVKPSVQYMQVRGMHSGLFTNLYRCTDERKIYINNLKLTGTFGGACNTELGLTNAGGLISNGFLDYAIRGTATSNAQVDIRNISFGSVSTLNYANSNSTRGAGLLIDSIMYATMDIYDIKVEQGANIETDALIGYQTGDKTKVVFEHIDLNNALKFNADDSYSGSMFRYGLLYFNYNMGLSVYYYDDGDYDATWINTDIITPGKRDLNGERRVKNIELLENITYAYKKNAVEINPSTSHILLGDGTKENPFVIDNVGQLTALYQALKGLGELADQTTWFVGDTSDNPDDFDPEDASTWVNYKNYVTWNQTDTEDVRKDKLEYLRSAYYAIASDIDLYNVPVDSSYKIAATDFCGLGIETFPFSGSIDGSYKYVDERDTSKGVEKRAEGERNATVTLNDLGGAETYLYGLVRYADGVNISNLNIQAPKDTDTDYEEDYVPVKMYHGDNTYYGMAIARVVGGDSVIDNVTATGWVWASYAQTLVGGLVGEVYCGTVTFTNMKKDAVKEFSSIKTYEKIITDTDGNENITVTYAKNTSTTGGYVGRVYESAICFYDIPDGADSEGNSYKDMAIKNTYTDITQISTDLYENTVGYPAARADRAYMINKSFLEGEKIEVTGKASTGYIATIKNEKQLYILSLAVRCGALSAYTNNTSYRSINDKGYFPYSYYAKTYKTYEDTNDDDSTIEDDRACYNSAVFEYFDFSKLKKESGITYDMDGVGAIVYSTGRSMLNQFSVNTIAHADGTYRTTYTLNENDEYDMTAPTVEGNEDTVITDFKGIGPKIGLYDNLRYSQFTFSSDFNGNGSTIIYTNKNATAYDVRIGLFNTFYPSPDNKTKNTMETSLRIYDFILSGAIEAGSVHTNDAYYHKYNTSAGALIGLCDSRDYIEISNVKVKDFSITANPKSNNLVYLHAGGLIGINGDAYLTLKDITIGDEDVSEAAFEVGNKKYSVKIAGNSGNLTAGGLCGYVVCSDYKNITVQNTCLTNIGSGYSGGAVGRFDMSAKTYNYFDHVVVRNSNINNDGGYAGGIIGYLYKYNKKYSLSGRELYLSDTEVKVNSYSGKDGQLIGLHKSSGNDETGFVDVKWEYTDGLDIYKPEQAWVNTSSKAEYFVINKFKDIEEVETRYNISGGLNDVYSVLESEESLDEEQDYAKRYAEIVVTDRIAKSDKTDRDYVFKYDSGEIDEDGNTIYLPTDLVPKSVLDKDKDGVADFDYDGIDDNDNLLVEWDTSAGSIEQVLNDVLATLTNGTGILNQGKPDENGTIVIPKHSDFTGNPNENIEIKVIPMQVKDGVASERENDAVASVYIKKNETSKFFEITNTNQYDKVEKANQVGTYSLIEISYNVSVNATTNNVGYTKKIYIPFMVCNMIKTDTYTRIQVGENYNAKELRNIEDEGLEITRDSSFTLYTEIMYSKNRLYFPEDSVIKYKKMFVLNRDERVEIPVGTRLTLVDTTDGISKTYYYEVKTSGKTSVEFTEFMDEDGNMYEERNIRNKDELKEYSKYVAMKNVNKKVVNRTRFGVEMFTIFVDVSATKAGNYTSQRSIWLPMVVDTAEYEESEFSTEEYFIKTDKVYTYLYTYDIRNIGFEKDGDFEDYRTLEKVISKTENLDIKAQFYNRASSEYWDNLFEQGANIEDSTLRVDEELSDYANKDKYLEVCLSLLNSDGQKILFPAGTKVRIGNNDHFEGIKSTSQIYYYKDSDGMFELDNKDRFNLVQISEEDGTLYTQHLEDLSIEFNFANAKLETLPAGIYSIELELLRTGNKDYPMGSEILDTITIENITVRDSVEYGFSISDYDKADLSYNKKDESNPYSLEYSLKLESSFAPELTDDKIVRIEYQLLKKNVQTGAFEPLAQIDPAVHIKIGVFSKADSGNDGYIGNLSGTGYKVVKDNQVLEEGDTQLGIPGVIDLTNTSDTFGSDKQSIIINDVPSSEDGILNIPFTVTMPEDADAVNYKIVATLYSEGKDAREAEDMVIFNISHIELY